MYCVVHERGPFIGRGDGYCQKNMVPAFIILLIENGFSCDVICECSLKIILSSSSFQETESGSLIVQNLISAWQSPLSKPVELEILMFH